MDFELNHSLKLLERTPHVLKAQLLGLSEETIKTNEGSGTWSPYDVIGHLIYGEQTDWVVRAKIILNEPNAAVFEPFDRFAQLKNDQNIPIKNLLDEFQTLRENNLEEINSLRISELDLSATGIHPEFGQVNLKQLLSTWVVHDLGHLAQISRVIAKQYKTEVGPWSAYLRIIQD